MSKKTGRIVTALGAGLVLSAGLFMAAAPAEAQRYRSRYSVSQDFDRDGIPNHRDRDIDGDGRLNRYDSNDYSRSYSSRYRSGSSYRVRRDWDRDGVRNRRDRDIDNDGVRNRRDRDKDGDGVRNRRDDHDKNPRRR